MTKPEQNANPDTATRSASTPVLQGRDITLPSWLVASFRWHAILAAVATATAIAANVRMGPPAWSLWVVVAAIALLGPHYLLYKIMTIDESWVDARSEEIHLKSYDRSHIQDISGRQGLSTPVDRAVKRPTGPRAS